MIEAGTIEKVKSLPPEELQEIMKQMFCRENNNLRDVIQKMTEKCNDFKYCRTNESLVFTYWCKPKN